MPRFVKSSIIAASTEDVFAFHERADALQLLVPPWEKTKVVTPPTSLAVGTQVVVKTRVGPFWRTIVAEHVQYEPNVLFVDTMSKGPFRSWIHYHRFYAHDEGCRLVDEIEYRVGLGPLEPLADYLFVRPRLRRMFDYRHRVTVREVTSRGG